MGVSGHHNMVPYRWLDRRVVVMDAIFRGERYGYLIHKGIVRRFGSYMVLSYGQVYGILRCLVLWGWVELDEAASARDRILNRPPGKQREFYRSTVKGRREYRSILYVYDHLVDARVKDS